MIYNIIPVPAPRMTRSDKWKGRHCVLRYFNFCDEVKLNNITLPESGAHIIFTIPMPKSWSNKEKLTINGNPHKSKPDIDNLLKALLDAIFQEDKHIYNIRATKIWGYEGSIETQI